MKEILEEWLEFSKDIVASDFAGNEQLEILRHKTQEAIKAIPIEPPVMPKLWEVVRDKTENHWLEIKDPEGWHYAVVKWDGCIHFNRYYNTPKDEQEKDSEDNDYLHICSVDDMINRLQALKEEAIKHFGNNWER